MVSNQVLQDALNGIKDIAGCELAVFDMDGKAAAATAEVAVDTDELASFAVSAADNKDGSPAFAKAYDGNRTEYIVAAEGKGAEMVAKLAAFQVTGLMKAYKEQFDKENFIKNLLLDNLLLVDIKTRANRLRIDTDATRVVYITEPEGGSDDGLLEAMKAEFADRDDFFVTAVDETGIIFIKEFDDDVTPFEMRAEAEEILKAVETFGGGSGTAERRVAYGNPALSLRDVSRSCKEARLALDVGKIFFESKKTVAYSRLGIGRLIYQLPTALCTMYVKEIFPDFDPSDEKDYFDEETQTTVDKFFENSLNVSETSRQLFIHRNTLVYRLDKLLKTSGLDLRVFDDAITFKIAAMVMRCMKHMRNKDL